MNPISSDIVEKVWKEREEASRKEVSEAIKHIRKEQPVILGHLTTTGEGILNEDERTLLVCLGMVVWQIMSQGDTPLPKITKKTLDEVENANIKMLEYFNSETDAEFTDTLMAMVKNYPQPEVLKFIIEMVMKGIREECIVRNDNYKGFMIFYLKTVIDCFNREGESK